MSGAEPEPTSDALAAKVDRGWQERGWPPELLSQARELRISDYILERFLFWNSTLQRVENEVAWARQLAEGGVTFRQVTVRDDDAFRDLWANSPEQIGDWDLTIERGPNAFAQFELQERPTLNALFKGHVMVACVSFSLRNTLVGGRRIGVRYGQALRVHRDHRRFGYANWVRSLPWAVGISRPTEIQYDYIRGRNMAMEEWNRKHMPKVESVPVREDDVPGIPVTVRHYPARPATGETTGSRRAREDDLARCVELINRTHAGRDLFRPYTVESLAGRLSLGFIDPFGDYRPPYSLDDLYVLEQRGTVVACAGLWDRGRDLWERWRHRDTGAERVVAATALLDLGYAGSAEGAAAHLIEHFIARTHELGRDHFVAALETLPDLERLLSSNESTADTRYLQWRGDTPKITSPTHLDLVYW